MNFDWRLTDLSAILPPAKASRRGGPGLWHLVDYSTARRRHPGLRALRHGQAVIPATREVCDFFGLDIGAWVREGLVHVLCPYKWGWNASDPELEMDFFCQAVADSPVRLLPFVNTWRD